MTLIHANAAFCFSVRFCGFFTNAHRVFFTVAAGVVDGALRDLNLFSTDGGPADAARLRNRFHAARRTV
ncbi:hypothetical protein ACHIPZ_06155, partial [Antrihabitans sp. NCIMB 15449]